MKDTAALKPSFFAQLPTLADTKAEQSGASDEERSLYAMSQTGGWSTFREFTQRLLSDLDNGTDQAMAQGLPFEEIGRNAVVINLAKGIIQRQLQKVEDAKDACEQSNGSNR